MIESKNGVFGGFCGLDDVGTAGFLVESLVSVVVLAAAMLLVVVVTTFAHGLLCIVVGATFKTDRECICLLPPVCQL